MKYRLIVGILWLSFILCLLSSIVSALSGESILFASHKGDVIAAVLSGVIGIIVAERRSTKERSIRVFKDMNKVFVQDKNIQAVIRFLNQKEADEPTINELELFLRFYEELDVYIQNGDIDKLIVRDLFYYYCGQLIHNGSCEYPRKKIQFNIKDWRHLKHIDEMMMNLNSEQEP